MFYDSSDLVLWRFDMIFKNLYLRKKSCFLTSCFLTFLLKMRNKLNHALSHHQMVVNKNSSEFFCQKYQLWEKILFPDSGMISHRMSLEREKKDCDLVTWVDMRWGQGSGGGTCCMPRVNIILITAVSPWLAELQTKVCDYISITAKGH